MYLRQQKNLDREKEKDLIAYVEEFSVKTTALYNQALFRIRQVFTGWDKKVRSENEEKIFQEIPVLKEKYPKVSIKRVLTYTALEKWMRALDVPEFFDGLPMQTAQWVVKSAVNDFRAWLNSLKKYKKNPSAYLGKPNMPGYKKRGSFSTFQVTNQDAVLYSVKDKEGCCELKLPLTKQRLLFSGIKNPGSLMNVCFKPFYDTWTMFLDFEVDEQEIRQEAGGNMAAIDFGVNNPVALAVNDSYGLICQGGAMKSEIRGFCMKRAKKVSAITRGKERAKVKSKYLDALSRNHQGFMNDMCHQISRYVINQCLLHHVTVLVLGVNKDWKQNVGMTKQNNQMFELMPLAKLRDMITYKAKLAGIQVVIQEESYTSKSDFLCKDPIPVYGEKGADQVKFSGHRKKRGLYQSGTGAVVNADLNGAANILRKAFPDAFQNTTDFRFLADPEVLRFRDLKQPPKKKNCIVQYLPM